jgi:5'-nucleotidase
MRPDHLPSHLGYNYKNEPDKICDLQLAAQQDIDLIIGHTHTFLDKPTVTKTVSEKKCNQGLLRNKFSRIDFFFDNKRAKSTVENQSSFNRSVTITNL